MNIVSVSLDDVNVGDHVWVNWTAGPRAGCGQGGIIRSKNGVVLVTQHDDLAPHTYPIESFRTGMLVLEQDVPLPAEDCIEFGPDCSGTVDYFSVDGRGSAPPRCAHHIDKRVERYENSIERYAHCSTPPAWFDPTYAGESWDGE